MKSSGHSQHRPLTEKATHERPRAPRKMQAAIFTGPREICIKEAEIPEPKRDEVLVRLEGCGLCSSSLPVWQGRPWVKYPLAPGAPGHEGWGVIERVGEEVEGLDVGMRVATLSYHAYAEYDVAGADQVVPLPARTDHLPFPGEPLGCTMNILRRCEIRPGQNVAVVGIGFLGALLTELAVKAGARVIAISRRPCALEMARRFGAAEAIAMNDPCRIVAEVKALTGGWGCDRVIEAVGTQATLDLASELTRERGRLIIAGYHQDGPRQVNMQQWNWKGLDVVNAHERDPQIYVQGIREAVEAVAEGRLDPTPLYTHTFTLEELPKAFSLMEERPAGFFKGLILYE